MSRAIRKDWQNVVTRRLSGGALNVRRYMPGVGDVQMNEPVTFCEFVDS